MAQPIIGDLAPKTKVLGIKAKLLSSYLTYYDTVFLVDDTASVNDAEWAKIGHALIDITAEAAKFDGDGISLYFVNDPSVIRGTKNTFDVARVFAGVKPMGPSHIGRRLKGLIEEHNRRSIKAEQTSLKALYDVKPLSIIVLTDGGFTEEPRSILDLIIPALREAKSIKSLHDVQRRVGVQFVQVGNCDGDAAEALQKLDDALPASEDAIDTVRLGYSLTVQLLYKILLGSVYDRLDDVTNEDLRRLEIRRRGREDLTWYGDRQIDIRKSVPSRDDLRRNGSTDEYRQIDMRRSVPVLNGSTDEYRQIDMRRSVPDLKPNGSTDEYRQIDMRRSVPSREDLRRNGTYTTDDSRSLSYNEDHHREINRRNGSYVADDSRELTYSEEHHTTRTVPRRPVVTEDERTVTITEEHHVNEVRRPPPPPPVTRDERTVTVTTETRRPAPRQESYDDTRTVTYTEEHRDITTGRRTPAVITDDSRTVTYNEDHHREANRRNGTYVADDSRGLTYSEDHHRETYGRRGPSIADDSRSLSYNEDHHRERTRNGTYITDDSRGITYNEDHYRERPTRGGGTLITDDERALTYNEDHRREYNGKNGTYTTDDSRGLTYSEDHHRERYGRGGSYIADDSRELTYNEDHHREYSPGKTITHGYSNTRDSQWSNQNGHETGRTKEVSTVVVSGRYPFQLAKNEFALSIPSGCRAVVTAATNAARTQRVIVFTNPVRPGFPEIFEGSGEGKPMRDSTGSIKGVTIPGGVWLVIQTDYAVRGDGFTKWVPARNKCVYRKGNTYQIGSDDGNPGGRRDYDYNDSVVTVKFLPANTVA